MVIQLICTLRDQFGDCSLTSKSLKKSVACKDVGLKFAILGKETKDVSLYMNLSYCQPMSQAPS